MSEFSPEEEAARKKAVFESMSPRRQKHIMKRGYDRWDPFEAPQDPIDIRRDRTRRTTRTLVNEFLQSRSADNYSNAYGQGALEMALGIVNDDERIRGMYEFACWYQALLLKEGRE
jgi:hypothetical protein